MPETVKLFANKKTQQTRPKNGENVPSIEIVEVVLVQYNLVDNQYQQKPEVLYTFTPNKSYIYLLNFESSNLAFFKAYNTEFDEIIINIMDQNGRQLEIEDRSLLIEAY